MKKILLVCISALFVTIGANAQSWGFDPKVGATFSTANGVTDAKVRTGLTAGLFFERAVSSWLVMEADLLFTQQGFDVSGTTETKYRADYVSMPVLAKYYLMGGLNFQLGAQFDYLLGAKEKDGSADAKAVYGLFNKYNISFMTGMAYDFNFGLIIEGRYLYGMTQLTSAATTTRTGCLQVNAGWRF